MLNWDRKQHRFVRWGWTLTTLLSCQNVFTRLQRCSSRVCRVSGPVSSRGHTFLNVCSKNQFVSRLLWLLDSLGRVTSALTSVNTPQEKRRPLRRRRAGESKMAGASLDKWACRTVQFNHSLLVSTHTDPQQKDGWRSKDERRLAPEDVLKPFSSSQDFNLLVCVLASDTSRLKKHCKT